MASNRDVLDIRLELGKAEDIHKLRILENKAIRLLGEDFKESTRMLEDLIEDIQDKIYRELNKDKIAQMISKHIPKKEELVENPTPHIEYKDRIIKSEICLMELKGVCSMEEVEREAIRITLIRNNYSKVKTAKDLGIALRTLRNKIRIYRESNLLEC